MRVVVYRRLMLRIAERLARKGHARALVTGEVIGQVASQTLENMTAIAAATSLEILRPLVGMDKDEITAEAMRIGTLSDLDHPGSGLLHAVHAAASGDARAAGRGGARRAGAADRGDGGGRGGRGGRGGLQIPDARITGCAAARGRASMTFQTVKEMTDAVKPAASVLSDRVSVTNPGAVTGDLVDRLVRTSVFGQDAELKGTARWILRNLAAAAGIRPASIHDLYLAMGRGDAAASRCRRSTCARCPTTRRARSSARRRR